MINNVTKEQLRRIAKRIKTTTDTDDCWEHSYAPDKNGYATIYINYQKYRLSRFIYEYHYQEDIPKNMLICHSCDNPKCVNPKHLFIGSHKDNMKDMVNKNRQAKGENQGTSKLTTIEVETILLDCLNNKFNNMSEVSRCYKVSVQQITRILEGESWNHISSKFTKEHNVSLKSIKENTKKSIKENTKNEIIKMLETTNLKQNQIAKMFGVSRHVVGDINKKNK